MSDDTLQDVAVAMQAVIVAKRALDEAILVACASHSLRDVAAAAGRSHESVRRLLSDAHYVPRPGWVKQ